MVKKSHLILQISTVLMTCSSEFAIAAEKSNPGSAIAGWPLLALFAILIIFRKKLFAEATPHPDHEEHETAVETEEIKAVEKPAEPKEKTKAAAKTPSKKEKPNNTTVDLSDDNEQCQASTAKGTRCKRTTNLETTNRTIDKTNYKLMVCKQHNTKSLKLFSELIK